MISWMPPAFIFMIGALLAAVLRGRARQAMLIIIPIAGFINLLNMPEGSAFVLSFLDNEIVLGRVDRLSMVFGYIFVIMAFAGAVFALKLKDTAQHVAAFLYAGSALGVVFAGDFLSLFVFWEVMALSSLYLVWARKTEASRSAGLRYALVHFAGGLLLFAGIVIHIANGGSLEFGYLGFNSLATWLILLGFAVNAAIPPLSAWLSDAYPEATITGTVFLSAYTTKTAVYVLARAFPGEPVLIWAGAFMACYGMLYAILENDMRRMIAYSIINQTGFMVTGIGIGTALAINGAVSHAFASILYTALLLMGAGSIIMMTGKSKCTELGGLYRSMPLTMWFCFAGAASISAFPLTSGFISKSMVISASGHENLTVVYFILLLASAGVALHVGLKFPWFVFFSKDSGLRPKEPPWNMLLAMGTLALLSIFIGVYPKALYAILPYPVDYVPYTADHVVSQLQILLFSALAFFILLRFLRSSDTISLDTDWFYRKGARLLMRFIEGPMKRFGEASQRIFSEDIPRKLKWFSLNPVGALMMAKDSIYMHFGDPTQQKEIQQRLEKEKKAYPGDIIRHWPIGQTILWVMLFLLSYLIIYYI